MKELKFIHITKTGGTSIEEIGQLANINWGRFHLRYWHDFLSNLCSKKQKYEYDWFMIVRNPYTRILSEYHCKWGGVGGSAKLYTKEQFNLYIAEKIKNRVPYGGHYTPQHLYLDDDPNVKIHVLKFENLKQDFNELMKKYNIDLKLSLFKNKSNKFFTINDISEENIKLINKVYDKDFIKFEYKKI